MGKRYIIEHVSSELRRMARERLYEEYVTEALKMVVFNTAGREERYTMNKHFNELFETNTEGDEEKNAEEIINRIKNKLGGS